MELWLRHLAPLNSITFGVKSSESTRRMTLRITGTLITLGVAISQLGCVSQYVQPTGENTAELVIVNNSATPLGVLGFKVAQDCSGGKLDIVPGRNVEPFHSSLPIKIEASKPFSFFVDYQRLDGQHIRYVHLPVTFSPSSHGRFELRFTSDGNKYAVNMIERVNGATAAVPTFQVRTWQTPLLESGSFCL